MDCWSTCIRSIVEGMKLERMYNLDWWSTFRIATIDPSIISIMTTKLYVKSTCFLVPTWIICWMKSKFVDKEGPHRTLVNCPTSGSIVPFLHTWTCLSSPIKIGGLVHGLKYEKASFDEAKLYKSLESSTNVDDKELTTTRSWTLHLPLSSWGFSDCSNDVFS